MAKVKEHDSHTTCFLYMTVNPVRSLIVSGSADETVWSWETNADYVNDKTQFYTSFFNF